MKTGSALILVLMLAGGGAAQAGSVTDGVWTPTGCGTEPVFPVIDITSQKAFGASLDLADAYKKQLNDYTACVFKDASADGAAINAAITAAQDSEKANFQKVDAATQAGMDKYSGKRK